LKTYIKGFPRGNKSLIEVEVLDEKNAYGRKRYIVKVVGQEVKLTVENLIKK